MQISVQLIGPTQAAQYLQSNPANRPLQQKWVRDLAETMRRGEWEMNGEAIKIAADGTVLDGQHRMHAIIKSGVTVPIAVISGLRRDVFPTIDQGKRRSASDAFSIDGEKNTHALATAVRTIHSIEAGGVFSVYVSAPRLREVLNAHPTVREWADKLASSKSRAYLPAALAGVVTLGGEKHGHDMAEYFMDRMLSGADVGPRSPILVLRERLLEARGQGRQLRAAAACVLIIKAWNAYVLGKPISLLRYNQNEMFPVVF